MEKTVDVEKTVLKNVLKIHAKCDAILENQALILSKLNNTSLDVEKKVLDTRLQKTMAKFGQDLLKD